MKKNKGKKLNWLLGIVIMIAISSFPVQAATSLEVHVVAKAEYEAMPLEADTLVPYHSKIWVTMEIHNQAGEIDALLKFRAKTGLEMLPYEAGVAQIDGHVLSKSEYEQLLAGNYQAFLKENNVTLKVAVKTTGTSKKKITADLTVASPTIETGNTYEIFELLFRGDFQKSKESSYQVSLYDDLNLIDVLNVNQGQSIILPELFKLGYTFVGFNTMPDGSGSYYMGGRIQQSISLFAIYQRNTYTITYYVDGKVYAVDYVYYGESAEPITPPEKVDNTFLYWQGNLSDIRKNTDVYAVFERAEQFNLNADYYIDAMQRGEGYHKSSVVEDDALDHFAFFASISAGLQNANGVVKVMVSAIPFLLVFVIGILYFYKKYKVHKKSNF